VQEAIDEALKFEGALARLRTPQRIAMLHYSPIRATVEGEPLEIFSYLGTSRLEEPLNRHPVNMVFHGHAHHGSLEGRTSTGVPVFNVAMPLLLQKFPDRPPFRVFEIPVSPRVEAVDHAARGWAPPTTFAHQRTPKMVKLPTPSPTETTRGQSVHRTNPQSAGVRRCGRVASGRGGRLSRRLDNQVLLKREDLQPIFSFKLRARITASLIFRRNREARRSMCIRRQPRARRSACREPPGIPAVIVMPQTTPQIKVQAVIDLGAEVILHGDDYDSAFDRALTLARERNLVFVHPFDDPDVIAGQGTVGVEILRQTGGHVDAIFVPIGGGGLISGIAVYVKYLYPNVRVIGVEPEDAAGMYESLRAGKRVTLDRVGIFADGVAVKKVGEETFTLCRAHVDEILLVDTDEICAAIQDVFEDTRSIVEPAGALAVAGVKKYVARENCKGKRLVAVNSGANMNFDRLRHVAERADLGAEREALLSVVIPEEPGSFLRFCETLGLRSVTEFNYRYEAGQTAQIFVGLSLSQGAASAMRSSKPCAMPAIP